MLNNYLTTKEASERLGIAQVTVIQYIRLGYLKAEKLGSQWLIHESEIIKRKEKTK